jgi:hypothetical protein
MFKFAGADWMQSQLDCLHHINPKRNRERILSNFGKDVADLLGEWQRGIYHLNQTELYKVQWDNNLWMEITIYCSGMSTFDFDDLTRLVFLAHERAMRIELEPATHHYMKLIFHKRTHGPKDGVLLHHPSLEEAVNLFKQTVYETSE